MNNRLLQADNNTADGIAKWVYQAKEVQSHGFALLLYRRQSAPNIYLAQGSCNRADYFMCIYWLVYVVPRMPSFCLSVFRSLVLLMTSWYTNVIHLDSWSSPHPFSHKNTPNTIIDPLATPSESFYCPPLYHHTLYCTKKNHHVSTNPSPHWLIALDTATSCLWFHTSAGATTRRRCPFPEWLE